MDCYVKIWALSIGRLNHTNTHTHSDIEWHTYIGRWSLRVVCGKCVHRNQCLPVWLMACALSVKFDFYCFLQGSVLSLSTHSTLWPRSALCRRRMATSSLDQVCFPEDSMCWWHTYFCACMCPFFVVVVYGTNMHAESDNVASSASELGRAAQSYRAESQWWRHTV